MSSSHFFLSSLGVSCHFACIDSFSAHNLADQSGTSIIHSSFETIVLSAFVIISCNTSACSSSVTPESSRVSEKLLTISCFGRLSQIKSTTEVVTSLGIMAVLSVASIFSLGQITSVISSALVLSLIKVLLKM